jgi:hypothetical protein
MTPPVSAAIRMPPPTFVEIFDIARRWEAISRGDRGRG